MAAATDPSGLSLLAFGDVVAGCTKCALAGGRTQVVFGSGSPTAELMFVGEAPGFHEDKQGVPFVGAAGQLLVEAARRHRSPAGGRLHRERAQVPAAGESRPAAGRNRGVRAASLAPDRADPAEADLHARELRHEAALRSSRPASRRCTGASQDVALGGNQVTLYPIFHPAAALYTPRMLQVLAGGLRPDPRAARTRCPGAHTAGCRSGARVAGRARAAAAAPARPLLDAVPRDGGR